MSGGKDSTAVLLVMLDRGERVDDVVFFDTGWEFPQMYDHLALLEEKTGITITRLHPEKPFLYWMFEHEIVARKGPMKGKVHRIGYGWPSPSRRWCTRIKVSTINKYLKRYDDLTVCIGFAADEPQRANKPSQEKLKYTRRFPLVEYGLSEADALRICKANGFHWDGLYDIFSRVSCHCCPLQKIGELRKLRFHYPELWNQMLKWDAMRPEHNLGFMGYKTVHDFERRFAAEESLFVLQKTLIA